VSGRSIFALEDARQTALRLGYVLASGNLVMLHRFRHVALNPAQPVIVRESNDESAVSAACGGCVTRELKCGDEEMNFAPATALSLPNCSPRTSSRSTPQPVM
jgi:hypothetical protein